MTKQLIEGETVRYFLMLSLDNKKMQGVELSSSTKRLRFINNGMLTISARIQIPGIIT